MKKITLPDELEWNFWEACPLEELEECKVYEAARRTKLWPQVFSTLRAMDHPNNFRPMNVIWSRIFELLRAFPEFPEVPWLAIEAETRTQRLKTLLDRRTTRAALKELNEFAPRFGPVSIINEELYLNGPYWPGGSEILSEGRYYAESNRGNQYVLHIAWEHSDKQIQKYFMGWLRKRRPSQCRIYNRRGKRENRQDSLRDALRELGAWSLSAENGRLPQKLSINDVLEYAFKKNEHGVNIALYPHRKSLVRAQTMARKIIKSLAPRDLVFLSVKFPDRGLCFDTEKFLGFTKVRLSEEDLSYAVYECFGGAISRNPAD